MKKEIFVERLKRLAPSKEDLHKYDLPDDFVNELIAKYECVPKESEDIFFNNDILLSLLGSYDLSKVEISTIIFIKSPIENESYFQIGKVDIDILALDKVTLQILVLDHDTPEHVLWKCAINSNSFLEAILLCQEFLTSKIKSSSGIDDSSIILKYVNMCTEIAGGDEYKNFYKMLLGYFD